MAKGSINRWLFGLVAMLCLSVLLVLPSQGQEETAELPPDPPPPITLFIINPDFPPSGLGGGYLGIPKASPKGETTLLTLLNKEFQSLPPYVLTPNQEKADYFVQLHCAGFMGCMRVKVEILNPNRDNLLSYSIYGQTVPFFKVNLPSFSHRLAVSLDQYIQGIPQGRIGQFK